MTICPCSCCIEIETPNSIIKNHDYDYIPMPGADAVPLDVFAFAWPASEPTTYKSKITAALWATYRHRMINCCCFEDEDQRALWLALLTDKYTLGMEEFRNYFTAYEQAITSGDITDLTDGQYTLTVNSESEDMPDVPVDTTKKYLSNRGNSTTNYTSHNDLTVQTLDAYARAMRNPYKDFAGRFEDLFLNRW